jgi:hypothetical protein
LRAVGIERPPHGNRPGADFNIIAVGERRHGQFVGRIHLQQYELAAVIGRNKCRGCLLARRQTHEDRTRQLHEIECTGNDVSVGRDNQPGGRTGGDQLLADLFQAADRADLYHRVGHRVNGLPHGTFSRGNERAVAGRLCPRNRSHP